MNTPIVMHESEMLKTGEKDEILVWPDWFPFWPNKYFIFFRPVFNISDSCITIGVFMILLFQKRYFKPAEKTGAGSSEKPVQDPVNQ